MKVTIPDYINAKWVATLADDQLMKVEAELHAVFHKEEITEKRRSGSRYMLLQGPAPLITAWHRWLIVSNETRTRGLVAHHKS